MHTEFLLLNLKGRDIRTLEVWHQNIREIGCEGEDFFSGVEGLKQRERGTVHSASLYIVPRFKMFGAQPGAWCLGVGGNLTSDPDM